MTSQALMGPAPSTLRGLRVAALALILVLAALTSLAAVAWLGPHVHDEIVADD